MNKTIYYQHYHSPIGQLFLLAQAEKLIYLGFEQEQQQGDIAHFFQAEPTSGQIVEVFCKTSTILDRYFQGESIDFATLDFLNPQGTAFQQAVWAILRQIPYGQTISYGEIAEKLGKPKAMRAVGGAVGRNPISILIPCHRVLGKNQSLTGFGGGLPTKRYLLQLEKVAYQDRGVEFVKPKIRKWS